MLSILQRGLSENRPAITFIQVRGRDGGPILSVRLLASNAGRFTKGVSENGLAIMTIHLYGLSTRTHEGLLF